MWGTRSFVAGTGYETSELAALISALMPTSAFPKSLRFISHLSLVGLQALAEA
jgi:hypothetical protein